MSFLIENPNFDLIDLDDPIEENIPSFGHSQDIVFNDVFHDFDIENFSYVNINPIQDFELTINHFSFEFEPKQKQKQIQNNQNQNQNQNNENQNNENQEERQIKTKTNPMKIPTQTSKTFSHSPFKLNNSLEQFDKPISFESEVTDALQFFQTVEKIDFIFRETEENPTKTETETPNEPNNKWQEESIKIKTTRSLISKKRSKRKPKDDESSQNNESSFYNMTNNDKQNIKKQRTILIKTKSKVKHSTKTEGKQVKSERAYILQCAGKFGIRRLQPFWDSLQSRKIIPQKVEMAKTKNLENEKNLENIKNLENAKNSEKKKKRTRFIKSKQATKHFHEVNWHDEEVSMLREYVVAFGRNWKKISSLLGNTKSPTQIKALYYKRRIDVFADLLGLDEIAINEDDAEIQQRQIGGKWIRRRKEGEERQNKRKFK
ncbi:slingshot protein phosphatase [Anaeramoeba ignava]|uniref:Slingshot protein phosphatase n=1 Tax=Anaeramoeba ignava TaxID=1746090 RepID=A0A9Q0L540_ANAIG|nr:slingshot protein phosphatase [Anaeramoeba ignava]